MTLAATVRDPLTEPAPTGWDAFATAQRLAPIWHSELLRAIDWCAQAASSMVLVEEAASAEPVAAFHTRHLGPTNPNRFTRPARIPPVSLTECRTFPGLGSGVAFAATLDARDRAEAVRVFERALRHRVGTGGRLIAYRGLPGEEVAAVSTTAGRARIRLSPSMVLENRWPDLAGYLAGLPRKLRSELKRIRAAVDEDPATRVSLDDAVEPEEACWLSDVVRRRHASRLVPRAPWPRHYFDRLNQLPEVSFLAYRDPRGRLLAFVTCVDDGVDLRSLTWGHRTEADGGRRELYFDQYLRTIEMTTDRGRKNLILGPGMAQVKARFGARAMARWAVVGLR